MQACLDMANKHEKEIFLLTEMSHPGAKMFLQEDAEKIAEMGVEMGITNYVAPSTRPQQLYRMLQSMIVIRCLHHLNQVLQDLFQVESRYPSNLR